MERYDDIWDRPAPIPDAWKQSAVVREQADRAQRESAAQAALKRDSDARVRELGERERKGFYVVRDNAGNARFNERSDVRVNLLAREIDRRNALDPSRTDAQIKTQLCREYAEGRLEPGVAKELVREGHVERYEAERAAERQQQIDAMKRQFEDRERGKDRGDDLERGR